MRKFKDIFYLASFHQQFEDKEMIVKDKLFYVSYQFKAFWLFLKVKRAKTISSKRDFG
jgi:hypothetical protein